LAIDVPVHSGDEEEINDPPDKKQTQVKKVKSAGDWLAIIEAMGAEEAEDPEEAANED
jgi:hypothetical protein